MLHPNQFEVNEAWLALKLNDAPIQIEREGSFNCIGLMDAASCFILGTAFVPAAESELSPLEAQRLLKAAWAHTNAFPTTLFVPAGQFETTLPAEARRQGISIIPVQQSHLVVFVGEARQSFREHFVDGGASNDA